jgi:hypothetical protein
MLLPFLFGITKPDATLVKEFIFTVNKLGGWKKGDATIKKKKEDDYSDDERKFFLLVFLKRIVILKYYIYI